MVSLQFMHSIMDWYLKKNIQFRPEIYSKVAKCPTSAKIVSIRKKRIAHSGDFRATHSAENTLNELLLDTDARKSSGKVILGCILSALNAVNV